MPVRKPKHRRGIHQRESRRPQAPAGSCRLPHTRHCDQPMRSNCRYDLGDLSFATNQPTDGRTEVSLARIDCAQRRKISPKAWRGELEDGDRVR